MGDKSIDISQTIAECLDHDFVKIKLSNLEKSPLILKNLRKDLIPLVGKVLLKISEKGFDIVYCQGEEELYSVVEKYQKGVVKSLKLSISDRLDIKEFENSEYERVKKVSQAGEYSLLGDIFIIWPFNYDSPVRISLFDEIVERIDLVNEVTFQTIEGFEKIDIYLDSVGEVFSFNSSREEKYSMPLILVHDSLFNIDFGFEGLDLGFRDISGLDYYLNNKKVVSRVIDEYVQKNFRIICSSRNIYEVQKVLGDRGFLFTDSEVSRGFVNNYLKLLVLSDYELFGRVNLGDSNDWLKQILPGDYLVHEDHGIGVFNGIIDREGDSYIDIRYANNDMLLVPISKSEKVSKYIGGKGRVPVLTTLNSGGWRRTKRKAKEDAQALAKELLQLYAMRKIFNSEIDVSREYLENLLKSFVQDFDFEDTIDQTLVTKEILDDMTGDKLMDRLLVGDVGFGKTEIAMRAAFLSLSMGGQVAVLAPTTILVSQHTSVFKKRLESYGFRIADLSRGSSKEKQEEVLKGLENGEIDLVIGTHSLLSDRVKFKNLNLVIIDEEQKFGVKQKEKLKKKRVETNVLSMSATPIPRSMHMSLSGIRDISMLFTSPEGRKSILNYFKPFDWDVIKEAVEFEVNRGGQVYFLHNRVSDIHFVEKKLNELFPEYNVGVLHGQMKPRDISKVMNYFCEQKIDVLICTTIIENGIDLPNVNTLIIDDVSCFGLSQLYQIRGRIGRSDTQAYAYFLSKSMKGKVASRLDALMEAQDLGSGFLLANRDLEIRGAGDLLGSSQSGNINSVGYGLFMKFLNEAIQKNTKE